MTHLDPQVLEKVGAQGRGRTADTRIFRSRRRLGFQRLSFGAVVNFGLVLCPAAAGAGLAFDPHILLLTWPGARQETVAATSSRTCTEAREAIAAGRWLAEDPPAVARCEPGSAFAPGSDCIQGYSCPRHPK